MRNCLPVLSLLAFAAVGFAQVDRATLAGTVTDPSGAVVPGVRVEVTALGTGLRRAVNTGPSGNYTLNLLPIGAYNLVVSMEGFNTATTKDVRLGVGDNRTLDVKLE